MTDTDRTAVLASPLLTAIDPSLAHAVLASCAALELPAGTTLLAPGDHNASLFLVTAGRLGEYEQAAKTDLLTGVHNRRWMNEMFPRQISRSERASQPLALVMADIDHFKRLNDTYGHATGDVVLKAVARRLSDTLRPTDFLVGGHRALLIILKTVLVLFGDRKAY